MKKDKADGELTYREIYRQAEAFRAVNDTLGKICATLDSVFSQTYDELLFTGCGTSFYLAQTAAFLFSSYTGIPARAVPCSELYFFPDAYFTRRKVLLLPVTRKSITTEVRMAVDKARSYPSVKTLAVTCDAGSAAYNDFMLLSPDADEQSIVMTSSFTSMMYIASVAALYVGGHRDELRRMAAEYESLPSRLLGEADALAQRIVSENSGAGSFAVLGQGAYYGVANECMNKIKEMAIASSEAYYSLEYRHGPMSLAGPGMMIFALSGRISRDYEEQLLLQMRSFGCATAAVGPGVHVSDAVQYALNLPDGFGDAAYVPVAGFIGQFVGYHLSLRRGLEADMPLHASQASVL